VKGLTWDTTPVASGFSPGGFLWTAYLDGNYFGQVYNDGWSSVNCRPIGHGSIHLAALRVQAEAKKAGSK
jgi:hypothetical protein